MTGVRSRPSDRGLRRPPPRPPDNPVVVGALCTAGLLVLGVITVLRDTAPYLHADGVMQSIMSLQGVELFFWGQNRFASFVPFLVSPITDPDANLFAALLVNALAFYGLLLLLARMGTQAVTGSRTRRDTTLLFLVLVGTVHLAVEGYQIYTIALDTQPYSLSWLLALSGYLLWSRPRASATVGAAVMMFVAAGLNPSVVLGALFLALVQAVRQRRWRPWMAFGAVWAGAVGVWIALAARFGRTDAVGAGSYYGFDIAQFGEGWRRSLAAIVGALTPGWFVALTAAALLGLLVLDTRSRAALLPRLAIGGLFCVGYTALFAGNGWVAANGYPVRYFFPVLLAIVIGIAGTITAAAMLLARRLRAPADRRVPIAIAGVVAAASIAGPLVPPADAEIFANVRATADFAVDHGIEFVAGNYWVVWPMLHRALADGVPMLAANYKAGGDPARYPARLDALLARGMGARALCLNDSPDNCAAQLDHWTRPGWALVPGSSCPVAEPPPYADTDARSCRVLAYTAPG